MYRERERGSGGARSTLEVSELALFPEALAAHPVGAPRAPRPARPARGPTRRASRAAAAGAAPAAVLQL